MSLVQFQFGPPIYMADSDVGLFDSYRWLALADSGISSYNMRLIAKSKRLGVALLPEIS